MERKTDILNVYKGEETAAFANKASKDPFRFLLDRFWNKLKLKIYFLIHTGTPYQNNFYLFF